MIKVWKCKRQKTGGYISIQPSFMIPYKQYVFTVIYRVLKYRLKLGLTINESLGRVFRKEVIPGYQTVQYWIKGVKVSCGRWTGILEEAGRFTIACPKKGSSLHPIELVHFIIVLERYLEPSQKDIGYEQSMVINSLHSRLLERYRGSPLSQYRFS